MDSNRLTWMDSTRGLCIILVLFVHTSATIGFQGIDVPYPLWAKYFNTFFEPFRMALLMFLSGMLLNRSLNKPTNSYIRGKFELIFWPFIIWSMVVYAAEGRFNLETVLKTFISAPSLLWYLWFLTAYYLLALLIHRYSISFFLIIALSAIGSLLMPDFIRMDRFCHLFIFFLLGHLYSAGVIANKPNLQIGIVGFLLALAGALISSVGGYQIKYDLEFIWAPIGLIIFILSIQSKYRSTKIGGLLEWVGRNSMVFYVVHFPAQLMLARLMTHYCPNVSASITYLTVFCLSLLIGVGFQMLRTRTKIVAALFDFKILFNGKLKPTSN